MDILKQKTINQFNAPKITIGIDKMPVKNDLKIEVLQSLSNNEDFALENDKGERVYFIDHEFMVMIKSNPKDNAITHLPDALALQNALKLVLLGHSKFIPQRALLFNEGYKTLKAAAIQPKLIQ